MRLLIKPLMPRLRPAFSLYPGLGRWIFNALKVNDQLRKMTRISGTSKRISLPRILLLLHHQVGLNPLRHSLWKTKRVVLAKENPNNKAKARILLPLAVTPPLSRKTWSKIRTKRTSLALSAALVSRKIIMPISALRKSQKTSISLDNLHISDWG